MPRPSRYAPDTLPHPPTWRDEAACTGMDFAAFFSLSQADIAHAKSVCGPCPVRHECLTHALTFREDYGVWGGLDEDERGQILRDVRRSAERQRRLERERARAREEKERQESEQRETEKQADATAAA
ncbi:transcription factor WhiB [Actinobacteria bacterium OV450]|nr:transcription factor WhiB [Actinobacteria bacterium OV450]